MLGNLDAPDWAIRATMILLAIGLPITMLFAWAFEITEDGIERDAGSAPSSTITKPIGKRLNRLTIAILGAAVIFLLADRFLLSGPEETTVSVTATDQSVAVLPFVAMSDGPDDEFFADGLTEEILNALAQLPELLVTARTSSFSFKGQTVPVTEIADKLGVAHIVEGSVRRSGGQMRITAQLNRAEDGFHLWSDTYDRPDTEVFATQIEISEKIALALNVVLDAESRERMRSIGIRDPEVYIAFQKGAEVAARAHESANILELLREANVHFEKTIELQPEFGPAYTFRADYLNHLLVDQTSAVDGQQAVDHGALLHQQQINLENAARYAINSAYRASARISLAMHSKEWRRLPELYQAAAEVENCTGPATWMFLAGAINNDWSHQVAERQMRCNPLEYFGYVVGAQAYINDNDGQAASLIATRGMEYAPHSQVAGKLLVANLVLSDFEAADAVIDRYVDSDISQAVYKMWLAAARGNQSEADSLYDDIQDRFPNSRFGERAIDFAILGRRADANRAAAEFDAIPASQEILLFHVLACSCGAPFDLEYTPNFARFVEEAEIQWPTPRNIEWPMKDW